MMAQQSGFAVVSHAMVENLTFTVRLQVQDHSFRSALRNKLGPDCGNKLVWVFLELSGEAVNSKVDCSKSLDDGIIGKDTEVGTGSQT